MGFFSGLNAEKYDRQYSDKALVGRIISYFKPYLWQMVIIAVLVLLLAGFGALQPIIVSNGVDILSTDPSFGKLFLIAGSILVLSVLSWVANWIRRKVTVRTVADVVLSLASEAFSASTSHDLSFYDEFSSGRILSRITSDTREFGQLITLVTEVISQVVQALILAVVLIRIDWHLFLYLLVVLPLVFVFAISYRKMARKVTRQGMQAMANVNAAIKETVSGIAIAKNFRQEDTIYNEFGEANNLSYKVNVRRGLVLGLVFPILSIITGLATALLVYVGGLSVANGIVTAGNWYLFISSLDRFMSPVMSLSNFWTQVQAGLSASERVFALIDAEPAVVQIDNRSIHHLNGRIDFSHVHFQYKTGEPVLEDFSLNIHPGETLALVGHTGAGKTSIAKLIARFYEFQVGTIQIDDLDIRSFNLSEYRQLLGIVSQVPFLFSGTIAENIRFSKPDVSDKEIEQIARQIGDGDWLETLPQGLATEVGERGARLSMGQRQLVSLMRVLVQRPAIFVLDEATASIDPFTEWQIQQALTLILSETTSILIAHRLSTVKSADRIIVMENGQIIEEGNHDALLERGGHYASLYQTYFRHQSLAYIEQSHRLADQNGNEILK
jgi:ATP-binding cassette, subfamily B, bacterial